MRQPIAVGLTRRSAGDHPSTLSTASLGITARRARSPLFLGRAQAPRHASGGGRNPPVADPSVRFELRGSSGRDQYWDSWRLTDRGCRGRHVVATLVDLGEGTDPLRTAIAMPAPPLGRMPELRDRSGGSWVCARTSVAGRAGVPPTRTRRAASPGCPLHHREPTPPPGRRRWFAAGRPTTGPSAPRSSAGPPTSCAAATAVDGPGSGDDPRSLPTLACSLARSTWHASRS